MNCNSIPINYFTFIYLSTNVYDAFAPHFRKNYLRIIDIVLKLEHELIALPSRERPS